MAPHLLKRCPPKCQSVVAMLNEISVAIKKLLTVLVFLAGWPTYLGDEAAASKQIQQAVKVIQANRFLRLIHARLLMRWFDIAAARGKNGTISALRLLCKTGSIAYTIKGTIANKKTHLYAISNFIL